ncbi:ATP-binding cassette domain-containing protein [Vibrio sp. PP-XX7]
MQRLKQNIDPDEIVANLKVGQKQLIEIAKALSVDVDILILDEPTSALSKKEVKILFDVISELTAQGVSIVYISHRLEELMEIGTYITILRMANSSLKLPLLILMCLGLCVRCWAMTPSLTFCQKSGHMGSKCWKQKTLHSSMRQR